MVATFKVFIITFIVTLLLTQVSKAQNESTPPYNIEIFISQDYLAIYIASDQPVSLVGLSLLVSNAEGQLITYPLESRFSALNLNRGVALGRRCYIYQFQNTALPNECQAPERRFFEVVTAQNHFWYDRNGTGIRPIAVLRNGELIHICSNDPTQPCRFLILPSTPTPTFTNTDVPTYTPTPLPPTYTPTPTPTNTPTPTASPTIGVITPTPTSTPIEIIPATTPTPAQGVTIVRQTQGDITAMAWSTIGILATAHIDGKICLWERVDNVLNLLAECTNIFHPEGVSALDWSLRGNLVSVGRSGSIRVLELREGARLQQIQPSQGNQNNWIGHNGANQIDVEWNLSGDALATIAEEDDRIFTWNNALQTSVEMILLNSIRPQAIAWGTDTQFISMIRQDGTASIFNIETRESVIISPPTRIRGIDIAWSTLNDIATVDENGNIILYSQVMNSISSNRCIDNGCPSTLLAQNLGHVNRLEFSRDGALIAVATDTQVNVYSVRDPYLLSAVVRVEAGQTLDDISWHPNGMLTGFDTDGNIYLWNVNSTPPNRAVPLNVFNTQESQPVRHFLWSPNPTQLAVVDVNSNLSVWDVSDLENPRLFYTMALGSSTTAIAWGINPTGNGGLIAVGNCSSTVQMFEVIGEIVTPVNSVRAGVAGRSQCVADLEFNLTGDRLLISISDDGQPSQNGIISVWDFPFDTQATPLNWNVANLPLRVNEVSWSPSMMQFAGGSDTGQFTIWNADYRQNSQATTYYNRQPFVNVPFGAVAWSPNANLIATGNAFGLVLVWIPNSQHLNVGAGLTDAMALVGHDAPIVALSWSSNGRWLASLDDDGYIYIWEARTGTRMAVIQPTGTQHPTDLMWSPNGLLIGYGDNQGFITITEFQE